MALYEAQPRDPAVPQGKAFAQIASTDMGFYHTGSGYPCAFTGMLPAAASSAPHDSVESMLSLPCPTFRLLLAVGQWVARMTLMVPLLPQGPRMPSAAAKA